MRNLELAFPDKSDEWRRDVLRKHEAVLARLIVDVARMHTLDAAWVAKHIGNSAELFSAVKALKGPEQQRAVFYATGHFGSFELLAYSMGAGGIPLSFVARNFKLKRVDAFWTSLREKFGNKVIPRTGALKGILKNLSSGRDTAILFDQNVTRENAVFVDFFGRKAATTGAFAMAAIRTNPAVIVIGMRGCEGGRYHIEFREQDLTMIYNDTSLSKEERVLAVTQHLVNEYEKIIREYPHEWFWMHRRWKTAPAGVEETFYKEL